MDIKLILENQREIMKLLYMWCVKNGIGPPEIYSGLQEQIERTKTRIERWGA